MHARLHGLIQAFTSHCSFTNTLSERSTDSPLRVKDYHTSAKENDSSQTEIPISRQDDVSKLLSKVMDAWNAPTMTSPIPTLTTPYPVHQHRRQSAWRSEFALIDNLESIRGFDISGHLKAREAQRRKMSSPTTSRNRTTMTGEAGDV